VIIWRLYVGFGGQNPLKSFSGLKKVAGKGEFQEGRQSGEKRN